MNLKQQMGVLISAATIRRDQWKALADNFAVLPPIDTGIWTPDSTIKELWEVWGGMCEDPDDTEAKDMSSMLTRAIDGVQAAIDEGKFDEEIDIGNK